MAVNAAELLLRVGVVRASSRLVDYELRSYELREPTTVRQVSVGDSQVSLFSMTSFSPIERSAFLTFHTHYGIPGIGSDHWTEIHKPPSPLASQSEQQSHSQPWESGIVIFRPPNAHQDTTGRISNTISSNGTVCGSPCLSHKVNV